MNLSNSVSCELQPTNEDLALAIALGPRVATIAKKAATLEGGRV